MSEAQVSLHNSILLIGDNGFLLELVVTNLAPLGMAIFLLNQRAGAAALTGVDGSACRLVLLALSQSSNEPVVLLAQAGLTNLIGAIPLLIISDRPFQADPEQRIFHLSFPFRASALQQAVAELLQDGQRTP